MRGDNYLNKDDFGDLDV